MTLFMLCAYGMACAVIYHLSPKRARWVVLLVLSYGFYALWGPAGLPYMLMTTLSTWLAALCMGRIDDRLQAALRAGKDTLASPEKKQMKAQAKGCKRVFMFFALLLNLLLLSVFKYARDLCAYGGFSLVPDDLLLPLGISFYTFQSLGYLLDVYNGKTAPQRNPFKFALFVSFFPQLIQGPIARYDQLAPQLMRSHDFDYDQMVRGLMLMLWGLFQKMVIADRALPLINTVFSAEAGVYGGAAALLAVLLYAIEQLCDFAGGIDLVTGIAQLFGIQLAPNFKRPYFASSLGDFWRRWHISLGAWMRDYVFYPFVLTKPMTGLTKAAKKHISPEVARALPAVLGNLLVFLLVGVWHGATSNYILWGLYNGVILAMSAVLEPLYKRFNARVPGITHSRGYAVFRILRTFVIVNIGWFFDRCARGSDALRMLASIVNDWRPEQLLSGGVAAMGLSAIDAGVLIFAVLLLLFVSVAQERGVQVRTWVIARPMPLRWLILMGGVLMVLLMGMWGSGFNEASFLYYQF